MIGALGQRIPRLGMLLALTIGWAAMGCSDLQLPSGDGPGLSRGSRAPLKPGEHLPDAPEADCSGPLEARLERGQPGFDRLVSYRRAGVVFKDEEGSGADRMMTPVLRKRLARLALLVDRRWSGVQLRVTEAWDEDGEHSGRSLHYGGRAADLTTSDLDRQKLGELAVLSRQAGFDWVYYEHSHVHVSVRKAAAKN